MSSHGALMLEFCIIYCCIFWSKNEGQKYSGFTCKTHMPAYKFQCLAKTALMFKNNEIESFLEKSNNNHLR